MDLSTIDNTAERTAHSYPGSLYLLPSDEEERERYTCFSFGKDHPAHLVRLSIQHRLYTRLVSGRLVLPHISISGNDKVLEIGAGTGKAIPLPHRSRTNDSTSI